MLEAYGTCPAERDVLARLCRDARRRGWWASYADVFTGSYIAMEAEASVIRAYAQAVVPGTFQVPAYARAVITATRPWRAGTRWPAACLRGPRRGGPVARGRRVQCPPRPTGRARRGSRIAGCHRSGAAVHGGGDRRDGREVHPAGVRQRPARRLCRGPHGRHVPGNRRGGRPASVRLSRRPGRLARWRWLVLPGLRLPLRPRRRCRSGAARREGAAERPWPGGRGRGGRG
jgi:Domain of unknown function (DUF5753)